MRLLESIVGEAKGGVGLGVSREIALELGLKVNIEMPPQTSPTFRARPPARRLPNRDPNVGAIVASARLSGFVDMLQIPEAEVKKALARRSAPVKTRRLALVGVGEVGHSDNEGGASQCFGEREQRHGYGVE